MKDADRGDGIAVMIVKVYRAYLAQSDVFVGLYWQRYGWVGPGMRISGPVPPLPLPASRPGGRPSVVEDRVPVQGTGRAVEHRAVQA